MAVRAKNGIEYAINKWQPTIDYLNKNIPAHRFTLLPVINLKEITEEAIKGKYDFLLTNPASFVEIESLTDTKAIVTLQNLRSNHALSEFGSVIFTHIERVDILDLKDLRGKSIMGVSKRAFGGWYMAWLEMLEQGINPHNELKVVFADSGIQSDVVYAVLDKRVDAGIVRTDQLERMEQAGKIDMRYFRVLNNKNVDKFPFLLSTDLYPEWPIAVMKHVPEDIALEVKKVLLSIKSSDKAAISGKYSGWLEPLDYGKVKDLMVKLKLQNR
ncbi:MAG: phosphate/phosphite/phosphonate ABC transporter substrate-binding protein [Gammaproteobacteria bacterium]|nr:phosphate/phosphite/phosphonate ABC transporter substrate-binding protein [Gammaproteobacteria bacterium]MDH5593866.1 phosphate/phosphite/phosphonate ABC transporter substrate-binding protein [Gammaproteobacteria bacterium]MDH5614566.1 phosphate/phosphite/phosphonate ABC transporter substrate-binding protein [Gammaproteobacteria bacterium]